MPNPDVSSIQLLPESFHEMTVIGRGVRNGPDRDAKTGRSGPLRHQRTKGCPHPFGMGHRAVTIFTNDPQCWRKRAREMRAIAEEMTVLTRAKDRCYGLLINTSAGLCGPNDGCIKIPPSISR